MKNLLKLSNEKLFEELYLNDDVVGVEEGIYFTAADITVFISSEDIIEYATEKGEMIDLEDGVDKHVFEEQLLEYYQSHEEEIDKHFFMEQVDDIRECIEEEAIYGNLKLYWY